MFRWLVPAAFVLPAWLLLGWAIFNAASQPWVLLPVLFIFVPAVFIGQLVATLLVRVRPSVRESRAVSWADLGAFAVWHILTILVGLYQERFFALALILAIVAGVGVIALTLSEMWRESGTSRSSLLTDEQRAERLRDHAETTQRVIRIQEAPSMDSESDGADMGRFGSPGAS